MRLIDKSIRTIAFYISILFVVPTTLLIQTLTMSEVSSVLKDLMKYKKWMQETDFENMDETLEDYIRHYYVPDGDSVKYNTRWLPVLNRRVDNYYRVDKKIYWSDAECYSSTNDPAVENADAETFQIAFGTGYAKDKNHVYYPLAPYITDELYEYMPNLSKSPVGIVHGANPETFRCLGYGFATDGNLMFYNGEQIQWDNAYFDPAMARRIRDLWCTFPVPSEIIP